MDGVELDPMTKTADEDESDQEKINVQVWLNRISKARQKEERWRARSKKIIAKYRDDSGFGDDSTASNEDCGENTFNILWANTETLLPALFSSVPKPDVRNRYLNQDKAAEQAGQVIERCLSYSLDLYSFKSVMKSCVKDYLLTGRGVVRTTLVPKYDTQATPLTDEMGMPAIGEDGQPITEDKEVMIGQEVKCELVPWDSFVIEPAKRWSEVTWVAFIHMLSKEDFKKYFPDAQLIAASKETTTYGVDAKYQVYEIWDKSKKKVYFVGQAEEALKVLEDPLKLEHFWPISEPLYSITTNETLVPVPEYAIYQQQAHEINTISYRITDLVRSCKFIGIYDSAETAISRVLNSNDSEFIPVTSNRLREGGIRSVLDLVDISPIVKVLGQLYAQRDQAKSIIYEVTGISDIIRGETSASETATAQNIKASYAGLRLRDRRDNINRFIVELLRMKAELICTFFPTKQKEEMSGIKLDYSQHPMPSPPPGNFPDPMAIQQYKMEVQKVMQLKQDADNTLKILDSDILRNYKIDIESDSTILGDMNQEAQHRASVIASIAQFLTTVTPLVAQGALPIETAKAMLKFGLQPEKLTRELEDALDLIGSAPPPPPAPMPQQMGAPGMMPGMPPQGMGQPQMPQQGNVGGLPTDIQGLGTPQPPF